MNKKTIIIWTAFVCVMAMISCKFHLQQPVKANPTSQIQRNCHFLSRQYFDGHYYIVSTFRDKAGGIFHDPDCPCHKKRITED